MCSGTYPPLTLVVAQATVSIVVLSPASFCILGHDNLSTYRPFHLMQQNHECATVSCPLDCIIQDFAISKNKWCPFSLQSQLDGLKPVESTYQFLLWLPFSSQAWHLTWMILIKGVYLWWSVYSLDSSLHHQWSLVLCKVSRLVCRMRCSSFEVQRLYTEEIIGKQE